MKKLIIVPSFLFILSLAAYLSYSGVIPFFKNPNPKIEKNLIGIEDPLVVKFERPVVQQTVESSFKLTPGMVGNLMWSGNTLTFKPVQPWKPGETYKLTFEGTTSTTVGFSINESFKIKQMPQVVSFTPENNSLLDPAKNTIKFTLDEGAKECKLDFKIAPLFDYDLKISDDRKTFEIIPKTPLVQDTNYQVVAYEYYESSNEKLWFKNEVANFQFKTFSPPVVEKIIPGDKEADVKEFTPIKAYFNKPMEAADFSNFIEINPKVAGKVDVEEDGKVLVFKPSRWAQKTTYTVKVKSGLRAKDQSYLAQDFISSFNSFDGSGLVHKQAVANADPYIKEGKYIDINLSKQLLTIFEDKYNMGTYRISTGKRSMPTPKGLYHILNKRKRPWSKKYKLFMPYFMGFTNQGHGIHELPEWPSGYKEGAAHLGTPVSHGCVRLGVGAAETVYYWAEIGTPVYVHY